MKVSELGPELSAVVENFTAINGPQKGAEFETIIMLAVNSKALGLTMTTLALENQLLKVGRDAEDLPKIQNLDPVQLKALLDANQTTMTQAIKMIVHDWPANLRVEAAATLKVVLSMFEKLEV